jgi:hypothetical protein
MLATDVASRGLGMFSLHHSFPPAIESGKSKSMNVSSGTRLLGIDTVS